MPATASGGAGPATLQTVERALSFLETVAVAATPPTIREVAERLGVNITTCYHLFNTLTARGYIERNPDQTLRIGFRAAVLYDGYRRGFSTQEQMNDFVAGLMRSTSETAWVSTLVNDGVVLTAFIEGPQPVRATGLYVGLTGLEHVRSSGRAVLAHLDEERRERILHRTLSGVAPSQQPTIRAALAEDLEQIRQRGWALDDQQYNTGIVGIAAPFFSSQGDVMGAVGIWVPAHRVHDSIDGFVEKVVDAAAEATRSFGSLR
jgi:IclR family acetate operon transcriptional repressor